MATYALRSSSASGDDARADVAARRGRKIEMATMFAGG